MASKLDNFDQCLGCLVGPYKDQLAAQMMGIADLTDQDRDVLARASEESLRASLHAKLARLLLVELNGARVAGRLEGADSRARWLDFLEQASNRRFWETLEAHYPTAPARIAGVCRNRTNASLLFAQRWAAQRRRLGVLFGAKSSAAPGPLVDLAFGAGDTHRGGLTVAIVETAEGRIVYKPRSLRVDHALFEFIGVLKGKCGLASTVAVPAVVDCGDHGWAAFVAHRYASDAHELGQYYRGVGHWLAIMRVLGGSDLHAENIIAAGAQPFVVDCETLFTPKVAAFSSELGDATDVAIRLVSGTVLDVGLLPARGQALGWRGVDNSGLGGLSGQQPRLTQPVIKNAGTDEASLGVELVDAPVARNHPSAHASLPEFWPHVIEGFGEATELLKRLDASGKLAPLLAAFEDCEVRVVPRATEIYAELARMLWHPVSLHNEGAARERARSLLSKMAKNISAAPAEADIIGAEIDALAVGDIPYFSACVRDGVLVGPNGLEWRRFGNLKDAALADWRDADFERERTYIRASIVSAYARDGWMPDDTSRFPATPVLGDLDRRRRRQAASIMSQILASAIRGQDGTAQWVAPVMTPAGWSVRPLDHDLYGGVYGVALLVGAYLRETAAGRADPVGGLDELAGDLLRTLDLAERKLLKLHAGDDPRRPPAAGAYLGVASQIWTRLTLDRWRAGDIDHLGRAVALVPIVERAAAADEIHDVVAGRAGAIVPLLQLWRRTSNAAYLELAARIGDALIECAHWSEDETASWRHAQWPNGLGGFAHGASGIGWALAQLAAATGQARHRDASRGAFAFEDGLYDESEQNWLDLRLLAGMKSAAAWCHGSAGIGLARLDLDPDAAMSETRLVAERAARATWKLGFGWNHCACHGDGGAFEMMQGAIRLGAAPAGVTEEHILAAMLTSMEQHGVVCGVTANAFVPSLLPGVGGVAYQLLRAHPESRLPSILTLEGEVLDR
jgi:type 2 lantibiotic biosynthesis protein LanM